jgi:hypothetical protein
MRDIVERLRGPEFAEPTAVTVTWLDLMLEAADEIERLRNLQKVTADEADELRAAFERARDQIERLRAAPRP